MNNYIEKLKTLRGLESQHYRSEMTDNKYASSGRMKEATNAIEIAEKEAMIDINAIGDQAALKILIEIAEYYSNLEDAPATYKSGKYDGGWLFWLACKIDLPNGLVISNCLNDAQKAIDCLPDGIFYEVTASDKNVMVILNDKINDQEYKSLCHGIAETQSLAMMIALATYYIHKAPEPAIMGLPGLPGV